MEDDEAWTESEGDMTAADKLAIATRINKGVKFVIDMSHGLDLRCEEDRDALIDALTCEALHCFLHDDVSPHAKSIDRLVKSGGGSMN